MFFPFPTLYPSRISTNLPTSSISIACWVVVFSPQIFESFRRSSTDGLSIVFIVVWLLGDVFNILGAVLQGVIPTMTILAVYYTFADIILLGQCFYYRGFTLSDAPTKAIKQTTPVDEEAVTEETSLLARDGHTITTTILTPADADRPRRSSSFSSLRSRIAAVDATHLSPATPLLPLPRPTDLPASRNLKPTSTIASVLFNLSALILVCVAGIFGWWVSTRSPHTAYHRPSQHHHPQQLPQDGQLVHVKSEDTISFDLWGQIFGYLCAILYLGSRVPQILLNYRRKSTEGVSMLFFLFACVGNLTYVLSIFAYEPACAKRSGAIEPLSTVGRGAYCEDGEWARQYGRYILLNTSWLVGSAGTLLLDLGIFVQFWIYRGRQAGSVSL